MRVQTYVHFIPSGGTAICRSGEKLCTDEGIDYLNTTGNIRVRVYYA